MEDKNKKYYQKVGDRIRRVRNKRNMTQTELGQKLSKPLSATAISLYEKGDREISIKVLKELAEILDVSFQLLTLDEEEENQDIKTALRADKELGLKARSQILDYIDFVKSKSKKDK